MHADTRHPRKRASTLARTRTPNDDFKYAVTGNVALGKRATQSGKPFLPALGVDGSRDVIWSNGSCTEVHRSTDDLLWWSVDLGDLYNIAHVTITIGANDNGILCLAVHIPLFCI